MSVPVPMRLPAPRSVPDVLPAQTLQGARSKRNPIRQTPHPSLQATAKPIRLAFHPKAAGRRRKAQQPQPMVHAAAAMMLMPAQQDSGAGLPREQDARQAPAQLPAWRQVQKLRPDHGSTLGAQRPMPPWPASDARAPQPAPAQRLQRVPARAQAGSLDKSHAAPQPSAPHASPLARPG